MVEPVRLAIVGCGGMGRRHLAGLAELTRADPAIVELVAVCDLNEQYARDLADEAQGHLGHRPAVFTDAARMTRETEGLEAADCTTDTGSHHRVATALLDLGLHTLCEKPLALT
ncbi:MAG TPA: Gfo/Idh/MocA family oxidoreductase, partial [Thermomicrobiales bacterium]|nr:Gfo/Idh/MocA family oxidoreductase [Thermomicrobiales bacterium]